VEPIDIWRSAKLMVDQYGNLALAECQRRSADFDAAGDEDGAAVWEAIGRAAESLIEKGPPGDVRLG
jgi:hypothetical protein